MPLQATIILLDNGDPSLNGDWKPDRLKGQQEAARALINQHVDDNRESSVALMTTANPRVVCTLTTEVGIVTKALSSIKAEGDADVVRAIRIASLVLKNRSNRNGRSRIILFCASAQSTDSAAFTQVCKYLKKQAISLDMVVLSNHERQRELTGDGHDILTTDAREPSFYVDVECGDPGTKFLDDEIRKTPIFRGVPLQTTTDDATVETDVNDPLAGIDPEDDPELYMVIQMSLREEEERVRRQAQEAAEAAAQEASGEDDQNGEAAATENDDSPTAVEEGDTNNVEDADKTETS